MCTKAGSLGQCCPMEMIGAICLILEFLVAALKKKKAQRGEINFMNIFYLTKHIQNIIIQ